MCIFIEIDKININAEKFDETAVTSIWVIPSIPIITIIEYSELVKHIITHIICLKIKNKTNIIIKITNILKSIIQQKDYIVNGHYVVINLPNCLRILNLDVFQ